MAKLLFLKVGWMRRYQGIVAGDRIQGGGSWVEEHGYGYEIYNFQPFRGHLYGFAKAVRGAINLERFGVPDRKDSIGGVTVGWLSTSPEGGTYIVGWYRNAMVYTKYQKAQPG